MFLGELLVEIEKSNRRREFMRAFSQFPVQICNLLISSQARDLQIIQQTQQNEAANNSNANNATNAQAQGTDAAATTNATADGTADNGSGAGGVGDVSVSSGVDDESQRRAEFYRSDFIGDAVDRYLEAKGNMADLVAQQIQIPDNNNNSITRPW